MSSSSGRAARLTVRGRSIVRAAAVVAGVLVAAWVLNRSTRVLGWAAAAVVLAALISPVVEAMARRMPRAAALLLVLTGSAGCLTVIVWATVGDLRRGLERLRVVAPEAAAHVETRRSWTGQVARQFGLHDRVERFLDDIPARLAGGTPADAVRTATSRGIAVLVTAVLTIFLISHGPKLVHGLLRQVDERHRRAVSVALYHGYRRAWWYCITLLGKAIAIGVCIWWASGALDLPAPSVLGVVVAGMSVIPRLGVVLGGWTVVLLAAGLGGGGRAAVAAALVVGLQVADAAVMARFVEPRTLRVGPAISLAVVLLATSLHGVGGAAVGLAVTVLVVAVAKESLPGALVAEADPETAALPERPLNAGAVAAGWPARARGSAPSGTG